MNHPLPDEIRLPGDKSALLLRYGSADYHLSAELLRVYSPSAEVRGHGVGQEVLQTGKRQVRITELAPAGNYALKITFSDGHDSGLFDWDYLYHLATEQDTLWQDYLQRLQQADFFGSQALKDAMKKTGASGPEEGVEVEEEEVEVDAAPAPAPTPAPAPAAK